MELKSKPFLGLKHLDNNPSNSLVKISSDCDADCSIYLDKITEKSFAPQVVALELTPACNNRCIGCGNVFLNQSAPRRFVSDMAALSLSSWEIILKKISNSVQSFKITGGEPTLYPQFFQFLHYFETISKPYTIFTNARWTQPKRFIDFLVNTKNCQGLLISLHGANYLSHDKFTGIDGSFEETLKNIRLAVSKGIPVYLNTVICKANYLEIDAIAQLASQLNVQSSVFNRYVGGQNTVFAISENNLRIAISEVERLKQCGLPVKFGNCVPQCFEDSSSIGCFAGFLSCTIDPWGNVRPCNHSRQIVGNLQEKDITEIWASKVMDTWRQFPFECQNCVALPKCRGGCRAEAEIMGLEADPLCSRSINEYTQFKKQLLKNNNPCFIHEQVADSP